MRETLKALYLLSALLAAGPAAADLTSDAKQLLRQIGTDPDSAFVVRTSAQPKIEGDDSAATVTLPELAVAPKSNPAAGLSVGTVTVRLFRRADECPWSGSISWQF